MGRVNLPPARRAVSLTGCCSSCGNSCRCSPCVIAAGRGVRRPSAIFACLPVRPSPGEPQRRGLPGLLAITTGPRRVPPAYAVGAGGSNPARPVVSGPEGRNAGKRDDPPASRRGPGRASDGPYPVRWWQVHGPAHASARRGRGPYLSLQSRPQWRGARPPPPSGGSWRRVPGCLPPVALPRSVLAPGRQLPHDSRRNPPETAWISRFCTEKCRFAGVL